MGREGGGARGVEAHVDARSEIRLDVEGGGGVCMIVVVHCCVDCLHGYGRLDTTLRIRILLLHFFSVGEMCSLGLLSASSLRRACLDRLKVV